VPRLVLASRATAAGTEQTDGDFVRVLDGHTLVIPDRRGNRRADTLRNVVTCAEISLVALVPGRETSCT
jgi:predicted pyridoxine 5'-phosphate oxidase superfamily flavin-nucleotide-binding protein